MLQDLISVKEAKKILSETISPLHPVKLALGEAQGLVVAEDIYATVDIPLYAQSSMDGYAICYDGWKQYDKLQITGIIAAGDTENKRLEHNSAMRIFTGAALPEGADTVIMQEKVKVEGGYIFIDEDNLQKGSNRREAGSEIRAGRLAITKNKILNPAATGFLAGIGISEVMVYPKPKVSIILTGDELQKPGKPLYHGQVYEANSFTLRAALKQMHIEYIDTLYAEDSLEKLTEILKDALTKSDAVILTGGISVGDYDFVLPATINNGIEKLFHRIKQKPAKPFYFGKKENKYVFGLPGNPASVLTAFYEYVYSSLNVMSNYHKSLEILHVPLSLSYKKPKGLTHFLKGIYDGAKVTPLYGQESFRMSSFAAANCLIQIGEETTECNEEELVEIHLLPS